MDAIKIERDHCNSQKGPVGVERGQYQAFQAGKLRQTQVPTAMRAQILLRGLQNVGITALVDEATGYQAQRPKDELRLILEAYISKELLPWTERFPEDFYKEMFRLRQWPFSSLDYDQKGPQGPRYAGKLTNELVYNQLPPGIRQELERLNPKDKGRRKYHHHRFLTGEIGHPHLEKQVAVVTALMRISPDWDSFMRNFNRNFRPHLPEQRDLFEEMEPIPELPVRGGKGSGLIGALRDLKDEAAN